VNGGRQSVGSKKTSRNTRVTLAEFSDGLICCPYHLPIEIVFCSKGGPEIGKAKDVPFHPCNASFLSPFQPYARPVLSGMDAPHVFGEQFNFVCAADVAAFIATARGFSARSSALKAVYEAIAPNTTVAIVIVEATSQKVNQ
jgi:hypothetical protein